MKICLNPLIQKLSLIRLNMKGILARKIGMTRVIDPETGRVIPVTLVEAPQAEVLQVKTKEVDGYSALVLGSFERKNFGKNTNKKFKFIKEVEVEASDESNFKKGDMVSAEQFSADDEVNLIGTSKGKGFAGVIKRHNFSRGPETHGSHHHREPGSVGMCAKPGRILKGKKMPGRMGTDQTTLHRVKVVKVESENELIALKGPVPGAKNSYILITS